MAPETSPITIERTAGVWASSNLALTSVSGGSIYLRSSSAGLHTATINGLTTGTLSLEQMVGNITINSAPSFPTGASVVLRASDTSAGNGNITISHFPINVASLSLVVAGSVSLINTGGSIGTETSPIAIERTAGVWTSSNLTLTSASAGSIYLKSKLSLVDFPFNQSVTGTLSLEQTVGNITIDSVPSFPTGASVALRASDTSTGNGNITVSHFPINVASLSLVVARSVSLTNTTGSIGTATSPITIERTSGAWTSSTLTLTSASDGSIYLRSPSAGLHTATISGLSTGTLSLEQTVGTFTVGAFSMGGTMITELLTLPNGSIILRSATAISIASVVYADSIEIEADSITNARSNTLAINDPHLRASRLSLTTRVGDIGSEDRKIIVSSSIGNETPDFSSFTISTPDGRRAHLIRLGSRENAVSAMGIIRQAEDLSTIITFYDPSSPSTILLHYDPGAPPVVAEKKYEGAISELLNTLFGSLGADCSESGVVAAVLIDPICSVGL